MGEAEWIDQVCAFVPSIDRPNLEPPTDVTPAIRRAIRAAEDALDSPSIAARNRLVDALAALRSQVEEQ